MKKILKLIINFLINQDWIIKILFFLLFSYILSRFKLTNTFLFYFILYVLIEVIYESTLKLYIIRRKKIIKDAYLYVRVLRETIDCTNILLKHLNELIKILNYAENFNINCSINSACLTCKINSINKICVHIRTIYEDYKNSLKETLIEDYNNEPIRVLMNHLNNPKIKNIKFLKVVIKKHKKALSYELKKYKKYIID